jgi:succinoglycan biosynthesis protein ExoA
MDDSPFITVVVPVRNEAACIERTLTRLTNQHYDSDRFEIIVADGRSTDKTVPIVRSLQAVHPNIRLVYNARRLSSAARNMGVRHGRGKYFVIVDGHCDISDRDYLKKMAAAFERSGADCLGRPQPLEIASPSPVQQAIALARRSWLGHNPSSFIYASQEQFVKASSVAVAYRRDVFEKVGFFDERFDACEDVELNTRIDAARLKCLFTPDIVVHYHPRSSLRGVAYQMSRYGRGRFRLAAKHPHSLSAPAVAPMGFVGGMIACAILGLWFPLFAVLCALGALAYLTVVTTTAISLSAKAPLMKAKLTLPLVFMAVHAGFAWGSASELFRRFKRLAISKLTAAH